MGNLINLFRKVELFEKLFLLKRKDFLISLAQEELNDDYEKLFNDAKKYLSLAKDQIREDLINQLGKDWSTWYFTNKSTLLNIPFNSIDQIKEQIELLTRFRQALYSKGEGDPSNKFTSAALNLGRYLVLASKSLNSLEQKNQTSTQEDVSSEPINRKKTDYLPANVQQALNDLLGIKLKTDGIMGPQTAQALQLFKNKFNNTKNIFDPQLQQDVLNAAKDKKSGLIRNVPF